MESYEHKTHQVACGNSHTLLLTINGLVYGCGSNLEGQIGAITEHGSSINPVLVEDISHIPM